MLVSEVAIRQVENRVPANSVHVALTGTIGQSPQSATVSRDRWKRKNGDDDDSERTQSFHWTCCNFSKWNTNAFPCTTSWIVFRCTRIFQL